jgi:hypothetical protein
MNDWQGVYDFFISYQDRIIYGTDIIIAENQPNERTVSYIPGNLRKLRLVNTGGEPINSRFAGGRGLACTETACAHKRKRPFEVSFDYHGIGYFHESAFYYWVMGAIHSSPHRHKYLVCL